jgi:molybdopterin-containing oxidoreductase family membrane subunit
MHPFRTFLIDGFKAALKGQGKYHLWMGCLTVFILIGAYSYFAQIERGLAITGMNDHVSWGLYISNFTFLVGLAAASVMLVLPAYIFHDLDFKRVVLIGEGVAVAALVMCLCFVIADMGRPDRLWHMIPMLGYFNFPSSLLAWDVLVLNGYLALNIFIPMYLLYKRYKDEAPDPKKYLPFVFLSVFWAIGIHTVTAFLYAGLSAKPFWNSSVLGIRFLASAFAAGPAFIAVALHFIDRHSDLEIDNHIFKKLSYIITVAAQINLFLLGSEIFKEFYNETGHSHSAHYLFFGLDGHNALVPWIWTSITMNIIATGGLTIHKLRNRRPVFLLLSIMLFIAIWIEKGMGLIIPGFIPSQIGEIVEYSPTLPEISVTLGIWALGLFVFTFLVKIAIPIEQGTISLKNRILL